MVKLERNPDFSGWATRNDLLCSDGRTIRKNAFAENDGKVVPLIYMHQHDNPDAVLGHAVLENRDNGVYAYGFFNDSESGEAMRTAVEHGDVRSLSIYANQLKQVGGDVLHGNIRELSLVLAGANPGAFIDFAMAHGEGEEDTLTASWDELITLYHSDFHDEETDEYEEEEEEMGENEKTIQDVVDTMNEEQQEAFYGMMGALLEDDDDDYEDEFDEYDDEDYDEGEETDMKHNMFDTDLEMGNNNILTHSDQEMILADAKKHGSFQDALREYTGVDDGVLQHDAVSGFSPIEPLFPEYKDVRPGAPELITSDQGWISKVLGKVHKSPISRIRTGQVDIRNIDALRAKGYDKGKFKKTSGNFTLVRRTTDPQTIYVKNALHKDDITDITDFDYVNYLYGIDKMMLNEELATAIMIGDGRDEADEDKIHTEHIRPIYGDDALYTMYHDLDLEAARAELQGDDTSKHFGENYIYAEAVINKVLYAREKFKGSGTPDFYCTPHLLNVMLLARDLNGRRIYSSVAELASSLNVASIITAEQFEGKKRKTEDGHEKKLLALICNLSDYSLGATKGGEISHFTQFDIDFNQQKSLLETRCSGALTRVYSAIALEEPVD